MKHQLVKIQISDVEAARIAEFENRICLQIADYNKWGINMSYEILLRPLLNMNLNPSKRPPLMAYIKKAAGKKLLSRVIFFI